MEPSPVTIQDLFRQALKAEPFPWQERLAQVDLARQIIDIPTGAGKTAGIVLAWLYRRRFHPNAEVRRGTPCRLVYCLPMRVLVEQTYENVIRWLDRLGLLAGNLEEEGEQFRYRPQPELNSLPDGWARQRGANGFPIAVHLLMGGEELTDWSLWPERDAILIGTQDMLLSRALNRGYTASRSRWPAEYGLLHLDALWVFDEVQLMDVAVATTAQMEGLREKLHRGNGTPLATSVWMSATLNPDWLRTIDFDPTGVPVHRLQEPDLRHPELRQRYYAPKQLHQAESSMGDASECASEILRKHQPGSLTLAIFNTVDRAVEVYERLQKSLGSEGPELVLIHSRFRPPDREEQIRKLLAPPASKGTIAITTQVIEAGVDISARTLFTELAPWSSLVQRFGRLNRRGEFAAPGQAQAFWWPLPARKQFEARQQKKFAGKTPEQIEQAYQQELENLAAPYELEDLREAEQQLAQLSDISLHELERVSAPMRIRVSHVLRKRDFIDLFDTTPDLAGNDIDVSRFIRSDRERDVYVFWRDIPEGSRPEPDQASGAPPRREELCPVPFYQFRDFVGKINQGDQARIWRWDYLEGQWVRARQDDVYPGQIYLIASSAGGYTPHTGWNPKAKDSVPPVDTAGRATGLEPFEEPDYDDDSPSSAGTWMSIAEHTGDVVNVLDQILQHVRLTGELEQALRVAARWHDRGKAHPVFQNALPSPPPSWQGRNDIAKAPGRLRRYERRHFRHELASALALLQKETATALHDLAVYLVAAHHGKVRLSIRSMPDEEPPPDPGRLFARGIWDGDVLPETDLGGGEIAPQIELSLEPMQLGRSHDGKPSWAERMLKLRDELGPCRLAFLEALLRAADRRASQLAGPASPAQNVPQGGGS